MPDRRPGRTLILMALELDTVADDWQLALDGAASAIEAADRVLSAEERGRLLHSLAQERVETAALLERLAETTGVHHCPWLFSRASGIPRRRSKTG